MESGLKLTLTVQHEDLLSGYLPRYNVMNEGIFSQLETPAIPLTSADIPNVDHALENDLNE